VLDALKRVAEAFRGGTFDVTVLEIVEGVIEIQASAGDARLGGEDFLAAIVERIDARIRDAHGAGVRRATPSWAVLRDAAERAKRRLSEIDEVQVALPDLALDTGRRTDVELTLTRAEAEAAWAPVLQRLREPTMRALRDAKLDPAAATEVLLVGGATRMPCVSRLFALLFGRMPLRTLPPDEAVAQGAAIQAALKAGAGAVEDLVVTDVAPFSMGIATRHTFAGVHVDDVFSPIIDRGTTIPTSRVERFYTVENAQDHIQVVVYQGEHTRVERNQRLGEFRIEVPRAPAGSEAIDVRFTYDLNGLLEVEATVVSTHKRRAVTFERVPGRMTPAQIDAARAEMAKLKHHPRDALPNSVALSRAEALYVQLNGPSRDELGGLVAAFRAALERQEPADIEALRATLNRVVSAHSG
jgi:molecular chaperone HscC